MDYVNRTLGTQRYRFLRALFALSRQVTQSVFIQAVQRALTYRVVELEAVKRIAWFCMNQGDGYVVDVDVDENYRRRPSYQEGCLTDEPDLSIYEPSNEPSSEQ